MSTTLLHWIERLVSPITILALAAYVLAHFLWIEPALSARIIARDVRPACEDMIANEHARAQERADRANAALEARLEARLARLSDVAEAAGELGQSVELPTTADIVESVIPCDSDDLLGALCELMGPAIALADQAERVERAASQARGRAQEARRRAEEIARERAAIEAERAAGWVSLEPQPAPGDVCGCLIKRARADAKVRRAWVLYTATLKAVETEAVRSFADLLRDDYAEGMCRDV